MIDEAGVRAKFGVESRLDPRLPGAGRRLGRRVPRPPGWGAKSTAAVLTRYEHLDAIPDDARVVGRRGARRGEARVDAGHRTRAAKLFLDLATLRTNGDVGVVDDWQWHGPEPELEQWAERLGSDTLVAPGEPTCREEEVTTMETLELEVGDYTFSARADGPADGELVLLLHGFPETSYEWRKQLPVLAAAGYRAVAPDQRGYASGARPENVDAYKIGELASDAVGFADALGVDRFHLVGHDWGGAVAWFVGGHYGDRLRTLTVVSTPHPTPFATSIAEGEQREKSAYMLMFRDPSAEDQFLANDGEALRGLYEGARAARPDAAPSTSACSRDRATLTGGLNWYRANDFRAEIGPITVPTMYVWSTDDIALGREAAEATGPYCAGLVPLRDDRGRQPLVARRGARPAERACCYRTFRADEGAAGPPFLRDAC